MSIESTDMKGHLKMASMEPSNLFISHRIGKMLSTATEATQTLTDVVNGKQIKKDAMTDVRDKVGSIADQLRQLLDYYRNCYPAINQQCYPKMTQFVCYP